MTLTEHLRTIRLYGRLGARFGRKFQLAVNSPAEAIFALSILLPGFRQFLTGCKDQGIEFAVFIGRQNLSKEQLKDPPGADDIRIAPVLVGSKRGGVLQTIIDVVLIVVAGIAGNPVPVAYGGHDTKGMVAGSVVISGGIYAEDQQ
nr:tail assembly protein [Stenotrophomonas maltophilia]